MDEIMIVVAKRNDVNRKNRSYEGYVFGEQIR